MNFDFYSEKIEAYLKNELAERDKQTFEQMIEQDPVLKSEFVIQKEIFDALYLRRKLELKQRLNRVEVDEVPFYYNFPKAGLVGSLAIAGALTSLLFLFDYTNQTNPKAIPEVTVSKAETIKNTPIVTKNKFTDLPTQVKSLTKVETQESQAPQLTASVTRPTTQKPQVYKVLITQSKLMRVENKNLYNEKANLPLIGKESQAEMLNINKGESSKFSNFSPKQYTEIAYDTKETDTDLSVFDGKNETSLESISERNKLSYQYYNNKLFLYNNGLKGKEIDYERDGVKRHFLFYENEFYEFFENQYDKSDLKLIRDNSIVKELKQLLKER